MIIIIVLSKLWYEIKAGQHIKDNSQVLIYLGNL